MLRRKVSEVFHIYMTIYLTEFLVYWETLELTSFYLQNQIFAPKHYTLIIGEERKPCLSVILVTSKCDMTIFLSL